MVRITTIANLKVKNQVLVCAGCKISDSVLEPDQMIAERHHGAKTSDTTGEQY